MTGRPGDRHIEAVVAQRLTAMSASLYSPTKCPGQPGPANPNSRDQGTMRIRSAKTLSFTAALVLALMACGVLWDRVAVNPFPFLDVAYVSDPAIFDSEDMGLDQHGPYSLRFPALTPELSRQIRHAVGLEGSPDMRGSIERFVRTTRAIMANAQGSELRGINDILSQDPRFMHICSEYAKVLSVVAQAHGLGSRTVWMQRHTTSEIFFPHHGWVHADAYGNVVFLDRNGAPLSLLAYRSDPDAATPARIIDSPQETLPDFNRSFARYKPIYTDNRLYMVLSGASVFDYAQGHRDVVKIIKSMLNIRDLGHGIQFLDHDNALPRVGNVGMDAVRYL